MACSIKLSRIYFAALLLAFLFVEAWRGQRNGQMNWHLGLITIGSILVMLVVLSFLLVEVI